MTINVSGITGETALGPKPQPVKAAASEPAKTPDVGGQVSSLVESNSKPQVDAGKQVNAAKIQESLKQINRFVQNVQRDLSFILDEDSGRTIIQVLDSDSGKLIRQIPPEEVLALANHLRAQGEASADKMPQGILFSESI